MIHRAIVLSHDIAKRSAERAQWQFRPALTPATIRTAALALAVRNARWTWTAVSAIDAAVRKRRVHLSAHLRATDVRSTGAGAFDAHRSRLTFEIGRAPGIAIIANRGACASAPIAGIIPALLASTT
jgi:hypothetical protein